jgi:hypothetical protein
VLAFVGKEMDLRNTIKNGILFLEDPVDKDWHPHFFVLTQHKLFYTDSVRNEQEADGEEEEEDVNFHMSKEVTRSCKRSSYLSKGSAELFLCSRYKLEGMSVVLNICDVLQNLFTWSSGVTRGVSTRRT